MWRSKKSQSKNISKGQRKRNEKKVINTDEQRKARQQNTEETRARISIKVFESQELKNAEDWSANRSMGKQEQFCTH